MHHAYHLTNVGKAEQGFAKLATLVQEMPWLREAIALRKSVKTFFSCYLRCCTCYLQTNNFTCPNLILYGYSRQ